MEGEKDLPDAENVSAVLFSNSGTIAKFNRVGALPGFGSSRRKICIPPSKWGS
jgi:hypothetical protein